MKHTEKLPRKIEPSVEFWNDIFGAISSLKTETIRQKEEIESIEAEKLFKQEEALKKKDNKKLKSERPLEKEKSKKTFTDLINNPSYRYLIIGVVGLVIIYFVLYFIFVSSKAWEVKKLKFESKKVEPYAILSVDDFVETGLRDRFEVLVPQLGSILLEPNTKIQRLSKNSIRLLKGEITAIKSGAENFLKIEVPGANVQDYFLGGRFKLKVSDANHTELTVMDGWVSVNHEKTESIVLPNHICEIKADLGIGLPYNKYSPNDFIDAVNNYCFTSLGSEDAMIILLSKSSSLDAVTLWNLMFRTNLRQREIVMFTLFNHVGQPYDVSDDGLKMLKKPMMQKFLENIEVKI
jgi:hypothetical protein